MKREIKFSEAFPYEISRNLKSLLSLLFCYQCLKFVLGKTAGFGLFFHRGNLIFRLLFHKLFFFHIHDMWKRRYFKETAL